MNTPFSFLDLMPILPEITLVLGAMILLLVGVFRQQNITGFINVAAIALLLAVTVLVIAQGGDTVTLFGGAFIVDTFARIMKCLVLLASASAIVLMINFAKNEGFEKYELPVFVVLATVGMLMMISANDLIALYVGIEMQSLSLYVLAAIHRDSARATEAGLKYFVLGALSSGILLYGCSLVYGFTGTTSFSDIAAVLMVHEASTGLIFGLVFVLAGLAFKISAVPFHMWTPDVYEGAPTPITAFFAAAPKLAAMALVIRVLTGPFGELADAWQQIIVFLSIASMLLGAFAAIGQSNIKRLMAYSSIGHMGYALIGLAVGGEAGVRAVLIYMIIYLVMIIGTFCCILTMRRRFGQVESIEELAGLSRNHPGLAFIFAMFMFSLAGIPPFAGFFAKFYVFMAAVRGDLVWLAVIGALASVVGAFYYLRIVKTIYFDDPQEAFEPMTRELKLFLGGTFVFILVFGLPFISHPVLNLAEAAARSLIMP